MTLVLCCCLWKPRKAHYIIRRWKDDFAVKVGKSRGYSIYFFVPSSKQWTKLVSVKFFKIQFIILYYVLRCILALQILRWFLSGQGKVSSFTLNQGLNFVRFLFLFCWNSPHSMFFWEMWQWINILFSCLY